MYNPIEDLKGKVEDTQRKIEKFSDYKMVTLNKFPFVEPSEEFEVKCCKKAKTGNIITLSIFVLIFLVLLISLIVKAIGTVAYVIVGAMLLISAIALVVTILNKPNVCKCQVATTNVQINADSKGKVSRSYNASVYLDNPNKVIAHGVKINRRLHDKLNEDEKVLLVKAISYKLYRIK